MKTLSIIIPNYNKAKYLPKCLNSIYTNHEVNNFDIIIVDDGSTDNSQEVIEAYKKNHDNISAFYQTNHGPSAARNIGIKYVKSRYFTFCDPDDSLEPSLIDHLLPKIPKYDWTIFGRKDYRGNILVKNCNSHSKAKEYHNSITYMEKIFSKGLCTFSSCNKIYKKSLVDMHHLAFNENFKYGEDALFNLQYGFKAKKILEDLTVSYIRSCNDGSLVYSRIPKFFFENIKTLDTWTQTNDCKKHPKIMKNLTTHCARVASRRLLYGPDQTSETKTKAELTAIMDYFQEHDYRYTPQDYISDFFFAFLFNLHATDTIYLLFKTIRNKIKRQTN